MNQTKSFITLVLAFFATCLHAQITADNTGKVTDYSYAEDSLYISNLSNVSLDFLSPKLAELNDTSILKITDLKSVQLLEHYYSRRKAFYTSYPADKLDDIENYPSYAEKYASGDQRIIDEVNSIINSGDKDSIKKLLKKITDSYASKGNPITDTELINFILSTLKDPFYEEVVIPLIASLQGTDGLKLLEDHLTSVQPENEYKLLYHLVKNNSQIGVELFMEKIVQEKDSVLFKSHLSRILILMNPTSFGKKIDKQTKAEISTLAINNVYASILSKAEKKYDPYSSRIKILNVNRKGLLNGRNNFTHLIENADERIIPFLLNLRTNQEKFTDLNINYINFHLLKLGYDLEPEALQNLQNDKRILRYMCRNKIVIDTLRKSENFYEMIFKDYITSRDINDLRFNNEIISTVLPYFKSVDHDLFKVQLISLIEDNESLWQLETQNERAKRLISLHQILNEDDKEVLSFLESVGFLSNEEVNRIRSVLSTTDQKSDKITSNLFRVLNESGKVLRFINGTKSSLHAIESSENMYLKDFKILKWYDSKDKVETICILYNQKAYAVNLNKYYPYDCNYDKFIEIVNFILNDNGINDKIVMYSNLFCDVYFSFIGDQSAIDAVREKYIDY
ncbi:hypothetical protein [Winogradskyella tangerina]|uniref:hypothetical protein n=1 Tax=Winogradskyella tangerina TaxID=2023240 RepID=UPI000DBE67DA|nr:hypothetical protein [Winogradskyella tangerina]